MSLSPEKVEHLAQVVLQAVLAAEEADDEAFMVVAEDGEIRARVRRTIDEFENADSALHDRVRRKITSIRRNIPEGSAEWNALYSQFLREERSRMRGGS